MNPNYRTLNNDIGMIQRTNNGWDLWFDNGDLVKAEDFHSLQVGIIIACLTSWNYMNRYGNPTYEVFGNRAYELLKANKSSMVQYKIQQFFLECLKRMRRVYDVVSLTVSEVPYDPYKYHVEFEVISINNQLVDGSFIISSETSKSSSYIEYITYSPYASNENDLVIDLWLRNEYGGGLEGEILYMYLKRGDDDYEFRGVVGQTDENGYLRITYNPWDDETSETRHSDDVNIIYFDFHGNTTYNPSTSKRTSFKTELFTYHIEFLDNDIATSNNYQYLKLRLTKESLDNHEIYPMEFTTITIIGTDGMIYDATTDSNGEVEVRVNISEDVIFTASYNNASDYVNVTLIKQTPTIDFNPTKYELFVDDPFELMAIVTDESDNPIKDIEVTFEDGEDIIGNVTTDRDGVAILSLPLVVEGTYHFTASIVGDNFYESVETNEVTVVARKHITDISLEVSAPPLVVDEDIRFTAIVTEEDAITGEIVGLYGLDVEFSDEGGNVLGTVSTNNGVAMFSTNGLGIGEHTISAQVVETPTYHSSIDSVDIQVLLYPIIKLGLDGSEQVTNLIQGYETTIKDNKYGGAKQIGYLSDGFDNTRDWVVRMNYQRSKWDGGLSLFFNPYTSEDCQCGEMYGWDCIFKNGREDVLQWIDGYIKINKGSNLSPTGMSYTWVNNEMCNVAIVKKASTITYYENGTSKGSYSFSNLANSPKFYIGFMSWSERSTNMISDITVDYTNTNN